MVSIAVYVVPTVVFLGVIVNWLITGHLSKGGFAIVGFFLGCLMTNVYAWCVERQGPAEKLRHEGRRWDE